MIVRCKWCNEYSVRGRAGVCPKCYSRGRRVDPHGGPYTPIGSLDAWPFPNELMRVVGPEDPEMQAALADARRAWGKPVNTAAARDIVWDLARRRIQADNDPTSNERLLPRKNANATAN